MKASSNILTDPNKVVFFAPASAAFVEGSAPVIAVVYGASGYYPLYTALTPDELNEKTGATPEEIEAAIVGSMFGWDVPGAKLAEAKAVAVLRSRA
jgi:hypothetical protein